MKNVKQELKENIDFLTTEQANFLNDFLEMVSNKMTCNKSNLAKLSGIRNSGFDTALPLDYVRTLQEIQPNFNTMFHVYDYSNNTYGELANVAEKLILKAVEIFND